MDDDSGKSKRVKRKFVGRGLLAGRKNPEDPQWYLAGSDHPFAPFPGNALKWESFVYDDGTTFEGLTRQNVPHGKGVMVFGTGSGAGIQTVKPGDRYEGEFYAGFAHGLGALTSRSGDVYRGEWSYGKRSGCGASTSFQPYYKELAKGTPSDEAWKRTRNIILNRRMRYGEFFKNVFWSQAGETGSCSVHEIRGILQEMEAVLTKSRMFQNKPDGDVTHVMKRDKHGTPVPTMQDPMHYPHGTMFLAPGPIGQCHPIPDDPKLKSELARHGRNFLRIYNMYNLPYLAKPGDDLFAAARLDLILKNKKELYRRLQAGEEKEAILKDLENKFEDDSEEYKQYLEYQDSTKKKPGKKSEKKPEKKSVSKMPLPTRTPTQAAEEDDIDDDDLIASTSGVEGPRGGFPSPPTIFASLSGRSQRLTQTLGGAARQAAGHVLPRLERRRTLARCHRVSG